MRESQLFYPQNTDSQEDVSCLPWNASVHHLQFPITLVYKLRRTSTTFKHDSSYFCRVENTQNSASSKNRCPVSLQLCREDLLDFYPRCGHIEDTSSRWSRKSTCSYNSHFRCLCKLHTNSALHSRRCQIFYFPLTFDCHK